MLRKWIGFDPFAVEPIFASLGDFADVYFGVEVGCKCFVVVACVAVYDVEVVDFVEVVFCCIGCVDACYAWVESASEYCC